MKGKEVKGKGMEERWWAEVSDESDDGVDGPQYTRRIPQGSTELVTGYEFFQSAERVTQQGRYLV